MNITDFLLARIAEDEADAQADAAEMDRSSVSIQFDCATQARFTPARVLAECTAKRALLKVHHPHDHGGSHGDAVFCDECQWDHGDDAPRIDNQPVENFGANPCRTLSVIAAAYADHPDYQQEWAPDAV